MPLKKYDELTEAEQKKVQVMYSDKDTLGQYLYNFSSNGDYHGRQYAPPSGVDKKVGMYGTILAESTVPEEEQPEEEKKAVKRTKKK